MKKVTIVFMKYSRISQNVKKPFPLYEMVNFYKEIDFTKFLCHIRYFKLNKNFSGFVIYKVLFIHSYLYH